MQARDLEEKHNVSAKVGTALGKGLDKLSAMLGASLQRVPPAWSRTLTCFSLRRADAKPAASAPSMAGPTSLPSVPR